MPLMLCPGQQPVQCGGWATAAPPPPLPSPPLVPLPQLGDSWMDVFSRAALLFFVVAFLTFMSIAGFPAFAEDMKVGGRCAGG